MAKKAKIISVVANKGGVSKTSVSLNLAYGAVKKGMKVLLVDLDPSSNATAVLINEDARCSISEKGAFQYSLLFEKKIGEGLPRIKACHEAMKEYLEHVQLPYDIHDVLENNLDINKAICSTRIERLDIVPSSNALSTTDMALKHSFNPTCQLRKALMKIEEKYDIVIIDNSPFENSLTYNSITSCYKEGDLILCPTKLSLGGLQGIESTESTCLKWLEEVEQLPYDFKLLITMKNRNKSDDAWVNALKTSHGEFVCDTVIRYQAAPVVKADMERKILLEKFPKENVSKDYLHLIDEIFGI